jgi:nitrite reductase (NADH) large subunit
MRWRRRTPRVLARSEGVYRKLVLRRGRLAGALLYGDISSAGVFYRLYRDGAEVGEEIVAELGEGTEASARGSLIPAATERHFFKRSET